MPARDSRLPRPRMRKNRQHSKSKRSSTCSRKKVDRIVVQPASPLQRRPQHAVKKQSKYASGPCNPEHLHASLQNPSPSTRHNSRRGNASRSPQQTNGSVCSRLRSPQGRNHARMPTQNLSQFRRDRVGRCLDQRRQRWRQHGNWCQCSARKPVAINDPYLHQIAGSNRRDTQIRRNLRRTSSAFAFGGSQIFLPPSPCPRRNRSKHQESNHRHKSGSPGLIGKGHRRKHEAGSDCSSARRRSWRS